MCCIPSIPPNSYFGGDDDKPADVMGYPAAEASWKVKIMFLGYGDSMPSSSYLGETMNVC
jgi:hypothetical protein